MKYSLLLSWLLVIIGFLGKQCKAYFFEGKFIRSNLSMCQDLARYEDLIYYHLSSDESLLATLHETQQIRLWEMGSGREVLLEGGDCEKNVRYLKITPDGKLVVALLECGTVIAWDCITGERVLTFSTRINNAFGVTITTEGKILFLGCEETELHTLFLVYNLENGTIVHQAKWHYSVNNHMISKDGNKVLFTRYRSSLLSNYGEAFVYDVLNNNLYSPVNFFPNISAAELSPDGDKAFLAVGSSVFCYDINSGSQERWAFIGGDIRRLFFTLDGKRLLVACANDEVHTCSVKVFDCMSRRLEKTFNDFSILPSVIAARIVYNVIASDNTTVISYLTATSYSNSDKKFPFRIWNCATGKVIQRLPVGLDCICFTSNAQAFFALWHGQLCYWKVCEEGDFILSPDQKRLLEDIGGDYCLANLAHVCRGDNIQLYCSLPKNIKELVECIREQE